MRLRRQFSLRTSRFGGIKSNVGPLIAEQNAGRKPYIKKDKSGKRLLVDPNITVQSVYNIYYWYVTFQQEVLTELNHT